MKKKIISNLIIEGGIQIDLENKTDALKINHNKIKHLYKKHGIILFKNFKVKPINLTSFIDKYTKRYSTEAYRREIRFGKKNIRNVDVGNIKIDLHSESSFNPAWPEIIWFFCIKNTVKNGETIFCDGQLLWKKLSQDTKNFFQQNPIKYELKIPIVNKMKKKGKKEWPLNSLGVNKCFINWDESNLYLNQTRFAVHESRVNNSLCFANHLFIDLKSEPQILSRLTNNNREIPKKYINEIKAKAHACQVDLKLEKNDLIMLNNKRFMHGRNAFINKGTRDIVNIQTFSTNFTS